MFLHDAILEASEGFNAAISLKEFTSELESLKKRQSARAKDGIQLQFQVGLPLAIIEATMTYS